MKVSGFKYLVGQGVENIWKNRMMAFASFCVLLVSLLLVGMSVLFYMNLTSMIGGVEDKNEVIIYMDEGTTDQQLADFQSELSQIKNISSITFYSKEQAFEDLKNSMSDYEVLFDSLGRSSDRPCRTTAATASASTIFRRSPPPSPRSSSWITSTRSVRLWTLSMF